VAISLCEGLGVIVPAATRPPTGSADPWQAFLRGSWQVTDHLLGECMRTLMARSAPGLATSDVLTAGELDMVARRAAATPVKNIAFDLGLSPSRVAEGLCSATRKLRLGTDADLVALFAAWPHAMVGRLVARGYERWLVLSYEPPAWPLPSCLSPAERGIVRACLAGGSHATIARRCGIAPRTVANHVASLHRKLNVHSRLELFVALSRYSRGPSAAA
jgi:DNA-binding CsgD family transcriptional regulator